MKQLIVTIALFTFIAYAGNNLYAQKSNTKCQSSKSFYKNDNKKGFNFNLPKIKKANLPEVNLPKVKAPKIGKVSLPEVKLPRLQMPKINTPRIVKRQRYSSDNKSVASLKCPH